jgi:hypothetical protein
VELARRREKSSAEIARDVPTSPGRPFPARIIDRLVHELVADGIDSR